MNAAFESPVNRVCRDFSVQDSELDGVFDRFQVVDYVTVVFFINIRNHIPDAVVGFQVLPNNVGIMLSEHIIDLGQYTRGIVVDVQQAVSVFELRQL